MGLWGTFSLSLHVALSSLIAWIDTSSLLHNGSIGVNDIQQKFPNVRCYQAVLFSSVSSKAVYFNHKNPLLHVGFSKVWWSSIKGDLILSVRWSKFGDFISSWIFYCISTYIKTFAHVWTHLNWPISIKVGKTINTIYRFITNDAIFRYLVILIMAVMYSWRISQVHRFWWDKYYVNLQCMSFRYYSWPHH